MATTPPITVKIAVDITMTVDEPIPFVPAEQTTAAAPEERCTLCKIKPSEGAGCCGDRDCKRRGVTGPRPVQTLDELRTRLPRPRGGAS